MSKNTDRISHVINCNYSHESADKSLSTPRIRHYRKSAQSDLGDPLIWETSRPQKPARALPLASEKKNQVRQRIQGKTKQSCSIKAKSLAELAPSTKTLLFKRESRTDVGESAASKLTMCARNRAARRQGNRPVRARGVFLRTGSPFSSGTRASHHPYWGASTAALVFANCGEAVGAASSLLGAMHSTRNRGVGATPTQHRGWRGDPSYPSGIESAFSLRCAGGEARPANSQWRGTCCMHR